MAATHFRIRVVESTRRCAGQLGKKRCRLNMDQSSSRQFPGISQQRAVPKERGAATYLVGALLVMEICTL